VLIQYFINLILTHLTAQVVVSDEFNSHLNASAPQNIVLTIDKIFMGTVSLSGVLDSKFL
jgi:hypothetical protein